MEDKKVKIHWVTQDNAKTAYANALGYNSHNSSLRKACEEYFDFDVNAPIAITITPADMFTPVPNKKNILFTMWEALDVPRSYLKGLNSADLILVPCEFCREVFAPLTNKPIVVCHEGVDPDVFKFKERTIPNQSKGERFRYLWVGAPNPRKGYFSMIEFANAVNKNPNIEVYFKTTAHDKTTFKALIRIIYKRTLKIIQLYKDKKTRAKISKEWSGIKGAVDRCFSKNKMGLIVGGEHKNIIFDSRKLSTKELVDLYHSAHCFLAPHAGEGWGLTLNEAMATGCPSVASESTGVLDFFDKEVGFPVRCNVGPVPMQNYDITARVFVPDTKDFFEKSLYIYQHYNEALKRGKRAAYRIKTSFTWRKAAKKLSQIINDNFKEGGSDGEGLSIQEPVEREDCGTKLCGAGV
jgi:glycosyltransferase involved in cell wall biosynthesis